MKKSTILYCVVVTVIAIAITSLIAVVIRKTSDKQGTATPTPVSGPTNIVPTQGAEKDITPTAEPGKTENIPADDFSNIDDIEVLKLKAHECITIMKELYDSAQQVEPADRTLQQIAKDIEKDLPEFVRVTDISLTPNGGVIYVTSDKPERINFVICNSDYILKDGTHLSTKICDGVDSTDSGMHYISDDGVEYIPTESYFMPYVWNGGAIYPSVSVNTKEETDLLLKTIKCLEAVKTRTIELGWTPSILENSGRIIPFDSVEQHQ